MGRGSGTGSDCLQGTDLGRRCLTPRYAAPAGWELPDGLADRSTLEGGPTDHSKQPWPHEVADAIPLQASSSTRTTAPGTPPMRSGGRVARFTSPSRWEPLTAIMAMPWLSVLLERQARGRRWRTLRNACRGTRRDLHLARLVQRGSAGQLARLLPADRVRRGPCKAVTCSLTRVRRTGGRSVRPANRQAGAMRRGSSGTGFGCGNPGMSRR